jgi:hypothetical protein
MIPQNLCRSNLSKHTKNSACRCYKRGITPCRSLFIAVFISSALVWVQR